MLKNPRLIKVTVNCSNDKIRTQQQFKEECDINQIVKRAKRGEGIINKFMDHKDKMIYGDFSKVNTFEQAQQVMIEAEEAFMELPARVRDRFKNEPAELLSFVQDDKNREEAEYLGL